MAVYFVQGKLGNGKTLASVGRIQDYLKEGRMVASNLDLNLEYLTKLRDKTSTVFRIPDKPCLSDLEQLPNANESYDESKNGLLVFDECGTWFNSRNWNDKSRQPLIDWLLHARKLGWDLIFIVQDISIVDKQAREALCEHLVVCRRTDRISIPLLSPLYKAFTGKRLPFPRLHIGTVYYGDTEQALKVDRWIYRGTAIFPAYDTKQIFSSENDGFAQMLTPWLLVGRYRSSISWKTVFMSGLANLVIIILQMPRFTVIGTTRSGAPITDKNPVFLPKVKKSQFVSDGYIIG